MLWTRSKTELLWGRKVAVRALLYPKTDCNSLTNSFSNFSLPWSEWSVSRGPSTENTRSIKWRTIVRAALSLMAIKMTHRVRWSMTERMKRFHCDKLLYSTRSTAMHWNARVRGRCPTGNLGERWEDLPCWQDRHDSIWVRTSVDIVGHQNLSRIECCFKS